jgi:hypothetical protein
VADHSADVVDSAAGDRTTAAETKFAEKPRRSCWSLVMHSRLIQLPRVRFWITMTRNHSFLDIDSNPRGSLRQIRISCLLPYLHIKRKQRVVLLKSWTKSTRTRIGPVGPDHNTIFRTDPANFQLWVGYNLVQDSRSTELHRFTSSICQHVRNAFKASSKVEHTIDPYFFHPGSGQS